jgi:putative cardiolipin synthase
MDDIGGSTSDKLLLELSTHTNIEVRVFNPIADRTFRGLSSLFSFRRITRRMHNKSFTVDGSLTILGGRNIADRYFGVGDEPRFADFEVLAAGPAAADVTELFERFWYSPSAFPIQALTRKRLTPTKLAEFRTTIASAMQVITNSVQFRPLNGNEMGAAIRRHELSMVWGPVQLIGDQPEKVTADLEDTSSLYPEVRQLVQGAKRELLLVCPYFIPGKAGVEFLRDLCERGIRVVVLSSSLAANDVTAVHVGYRRYRKDLLRAGVELWEMKPDVHVRSSAREREPTRARLRENKPRSSLHTKAFTFDRQTLFVGSLNLDPRSVALNTEMGLVINIPGLADTATDLLEEKLPQNAYRLRYVPDGKTCGHIVWISEENGQEVRYSHEPHATILQHLTVSLLSWLPIESQL